MHGPAHIEFSLRLLGRFAVASAESPAVPIRITSKKGSALLAFLAMQPERIAGREQLSTMLWGDTFDKNARQNLRQCIASLREDLAPFAADLLQVERDTVALRSHRVTVDVHEFARFAQSGEPSDLARAAELYEGEFLAGLCLEVEPFDDWLRAERGRLEATAAHVFVSYADCMDRRGEGKIAIAAAERLVALDPLREDWHRLLLRLLARHRGPDAALACAKALAEGLKRELDVDPDPATMAVVADIRRAMLAPPAPILLPDEFAARAVSAPRADPPTDAPSLPAPAMSFRKRLSHRTFPLLAAVLVLSLPAYWVFAHNSATPPWSAGSDPLSRASGVSQTPSWAPPFPTAGLSDLAARAIIPIIVLPFTASGPDQALADAITDDLTNNVSRAQTLRVISRQSAQFYKGRPVDAAALGAELGVRYLVEGSIRSQAGRVRVNVRLVDTASRLQVWADLFERDQGDRFDVQDEISRRLARELNVEIPAAVSRRPAGGSGREPAMDDLIAKGLTAQLRGPAAENIAEALTYFEEALSRQPDLVPALVGAAAQRVMGSINFILDPSPNLAQAEKLLARAQQLAPESAIVPYWLGMLAKARGRFDEALRLFDRALEINPSLASAHQQIGSTMTLTGRLEEAMPHILYGMRLSPKDPTRGIGCLIAGVAEIEVGHDQAALEWFQRSAALVPHNPNIHRLLAAAYALAGDKTKAAASLAEFKRLAAPVAVERLTRAALHGTDASGRPLRSLQGFALALESSS